jgi:hypothetical protein
MYLLVFLSLFLSVRTLKFNKQRARPDATQEDLLSTFVTTETAANEIGFRFVHSH